MKSGGKILLIDDDALLMDCYVRVFQDLGCEITVRRSVLDALEYVDNFAHLVDGIILDWLMPQCTLESLEEFKPGTEALPEFGGQGILEHITAKHPGIPVIVLTNCNPAIIPVRAESVVAVSKFECSPFELRLLAGRHFGITFGRLP